MGSEIMEEYYDAILFEYKKSLRVVYKELDITTYETTSELIDKIKRIKLEIDSNLKPLINYYERDNIL